MGVSIIIITVFVLGHLVDSVMWVWSVLAYTCEQPTCHCQYAAEATSYAFVSLSLSLLSLFLSLSLFSLSLFSLSSLSLTLPSTDSRSCRCVPEATTHRYWTFERSNLTLPTRDSTSSLRELLPSLTSSHRHSLRYVCTYSYDADTI